MSASSRDHEPPHQFNMDRTPTSSTLAELVLTHISPPSSPGSRSSAPSRSRTDSVNDSSDEENSWSSDERARSRGLGSTRGSQTGSGNERGREAELVMPSMHLLSPAEFDGFERESGAMGARTRILLAGRSEEERSTLARLLLAKQPATDDLSQSVLSQFDSTRSSYNESASYNIDGMEVMGEGERVLFYQPANTMLNGDELADLLEKPYQRLERMLNPSFPSTIGLEDHINRLANEELDACLFLFSSPPTQSEIVLARSISHVLPLLPVLLLPPSLKPQKTNVLVSAVSDQLTARGVRWISASTVSRKYTEKDRPLFLLPHSLFVRQRRADSYQSSASGFSSLASSQELPPVSPAHHLSSATTNGEDIVDLSRLQDLGTTTISRDLLKRQQTRSFLDWREIELASRGERIWTLDELPVEWREVAVVDEPKEAERSLRFSQRVAERREWKLVKEERARSGMKEGQTRFADETEGSDEEEREAREVDEELSARAQRMRRASSTYTDPTTPLCRPLPLGTFSSHSASHCSSSPPLDTDCAFNYSYFPTVQSSSTPYYVSDKLNAGQGVDKAEPGAADMIHAEDPFHFPSLLHLVGLNLRMSLLPTSRYRLEYTNEVGAGSSTLRWVGTVAIFSAVFLAGMLSSRAGGLVLNLFLSERGRISY